MTTRTPRVTNGVGFWRGEHHNDYCITCGKPVPLWFDIRKCNDCLTFLTSAEIEKLLRRR